MKRHTIHFVKSEFLKRGYTLLSDSYVNNRIKLKYVCSNGHTNSITWHDFEVGKGCPNCAGLAKLNIEYIREMFNHEKYVLLNEEYSNNKQKLKYICPNNHTGLIRWDVWQRGIRCPICYFIRNSGSGNHMWCGGVSFEPYCPIWKDKEYKKDIKIRDGNKCLNPCCFSKNSNDLVIHHIDYNKKNCGPNNLITICRSCNNTANKDREWHTAWYQALIYNRYKRSKQ